MILADFCTGVAYAASAAVWDRSNVRPSKNRGKTGQYHCRTSRDGCSYYVYVPANYSASNPAGIHVFFHGQNLQGGAGDFSPWAACFLDRYNLIGINMEYSDGDNSRDTNGKALAAEEAIAQVMADYKVIKGRGVICSFASGGLVHGVLHKRYGQESRGRPTWPFSHTAIYSSNFLKTASDALLMSWFVGLGADEWKERVSPNVGRWFPNAPRLGPELGTTELKRAQELFADVESGGCPDVYFRIIRNKGHELSQEDVVASAEAFARSDIAFAPFIYAPDFAERELVPVVLLANSHAYGKADELLGKVALGARGPMRQKVQALKALLDTRTEKLVSLAEYLAKRDAVLGSYYGGLFIRQLAGHPRQRLVFDAVLKMQQREDFRRAIGAFELFQNQIGNFFEDGKLSPRMLPVLEQVRQASGDQSLYGKMAAEYLQLKE